MKALSPKLILCNAITVFILQSCFTGKIKTWYPKMGKKSAENNVLKISRNNDHEKNI